MLMKLRLRRLSCQVEHFVSIVSVNVLLIYKEKGKVLSTSLNTFYKPWKCCLNWRFTE